MINFNGVQKSFAYVHEKTSVNVMDFYLATVFTITKTKTILRVRYQTLKIGILEPYYDTKCTKYPLRSSQIDQIYKITQAEAAEVEQIDIRCRDIRTGRQEWWYQTLCGTMTDCAKGSLGVNVNFSFYFLTFQLDFFTLDVTYVYSQKLQ